MAKSEIPPHKSEGTNFPPTRQTTREWLWWMAWALGMSFVFGSCVGLVIWIVMEYGI